MKRIIDGVTYNTDTAMVVARSTWHEDAGYGVVESDNEHTLYRTRGGAFFVVERKEFHKKKNDEWIPVEEVEFVPMTQDQAQTWTLTGTVEMIDGTVFGEPPEAEAEVGTSATIYLRIPAPLKSRIEAKAASEGQSVNAWLMRCAERDLQSDRVDAPAVDKTTTETQYRDCTGAPIHPSLLRRKVVEFEPIIVTHGPSDADVRATAAAIAKSRTVTVRSEDLSPKTRTVKVRIGGTQEED